METPRESWKTTSDGYIDAFEIDNMSAFSGYSKNSKPKRADTVGIEKKDALVTYNNIEDSLWVTYQSEVTVSYNQVKHSPDKYLSLNLSLCQLLVKGNSISIKSHSIFRKKGQITKWKIPH